MARMTSPVRRFALRAAVAALAAGLLPAPALAGTDDAPAELSGAATAAGTPGDALPAPAAAAAAAAARTAVAAVPPAARAQVLGAGSDTSGDRAWTTAGDGDGFHVLVADAASGYAWRTVATLAVPGLESDQWIGNACVTGSGRRAVVAYAPRTFTNEPVLFERGAFTAVVDLVTGGVRRLPVRTSLAYFNPGCGPGETVAVTQGGVEDLGRTRVLPVDAVAGRLGRPIETPGQLTSAVATPGGIVAADSGALVRLQPDGTRRVLARAAGVPYRLTPDAAGGVVFVEKTGTDRATVRRASGTPGREPVTVATGALTALDVVAGRGGRVSVLGTGRSAAVAGVPGVSLVNAPARAQVSTNGRLAVTSVLRTDAADPRTPVESPGAPRPLAISATALATGETVTFAHRPPARLLSDPGDPSDAAERYCSVPRNDPRNQAMQPKPRQVEWAVDQAVRKVLDVQRPANWKNLGMPAYRPQELFPAEDLLGGGYVPAQVMLGIAAQESNLWQAARYAVPGVTANPLIGNYYGLQIYNDTPDDDWTIRFDHADCGYGVTQVTDGMRLAGREKPGERALPPDHQRAVALDFAANVAAGLQILQRKWNEITASNIWVNDGDPARIENWFFAVWAYNSGFHPNQRDGSPWGLGWSNNPINPNYLAGRAPFLELTYDDARTPQQWPYPEKVMGWAGHPVEVLEAPDQLVAGYRPAWWPGDTSDDAVLNRMRVKPRPELFCDNSNDCDPNGRFVPDADEVVGEPAGPCHHKNAAGRYDLRCWYHVPVTWKADCDSTCGRELLRFDPGYAYQDDGTAYPPTCDLSGLPPGSLVVDDVPDGTPSVRPGCPRTWTNAGTFELDFRPDATGHHPGKIDTHQIGAGFGGHFWMTNARPTAHQLSFDAWWRFTTPVTGLARVYVFVPETGAGNAGTLYQVRTKHGWRAATVRQKETGTGNRWVPLGIFPFDGRPEVTLGTGTPDGNGSQRVAIDAVAVAPVATKTIGVLNWNLAGATRNDGDPEVVDRLIREIHDRRPDVVSLNEVCENQSDYLREKLDESGYHMEVDFHATQEGNFTCFNAGDWSLRAGNAILARGTKVRKQTYIFDGDDELREISTVYTGRGVGCMTVRLTDTAADTKACTTHLSQKAEGTRREAQARELARVFGPEARRMPFILAGDLNIHTPPRSEALGSLYALPAGSGDFLEVNGERGCLTEPQCVQSQGGEPTHPEDPLPDNGVDDDSKLDYIFASQWHTSVPIGRSSVNRDVGSCGADDHGCSDHWLFYGEVNLPRG
jgi:endonuclease/exonuclease/phosphatase family metal-dependent hydrolase